MSETSKYQNRIERLQGSKQLAKYYKLTALGKKQLAADHQRWLRFVHAFGAIMESGVQV
jgi:PadR family transcriptional regulator PadR